MACHIVHFQNLTAIAAKLWELTEIERYIMEKVKEKRKELKMTQAHLSFLLEKNDSFVAQVEANQNRLKYNINHVNALAKIFNCSPRDFLPENPV